MRSLLDVFFPPACASCGARGDAPLCARCERSARWFADTPSCRRCAMPSARVVWSCRSCVAVSPAFAAASAAAVYEHGARDLLMAFKLGGERRAAPWMAERMAAVVVGRPDAVTYVPSSRRSLAERGFDPARELALHAGRALGVPVRRLLRVRRQPADQAGLARAERLANLEGVFVGCASKERLGLVTLVDDVLTTGATADACARALLEAGIGKIEVLTFARAI